MGIAYNTSIVRNGLILLLDAANPKSYPGSGSTWFDISNNNINFTLVNSPTYNSNGYFTFDGISQYATRSSLFQSPDDSFNSFSIWFRPLATPPVNRPIWSDSFGPELGVWRDASNNVRAYTYGGSTATNVPNNTWVNVTFTFFASAANSGLTYQMSTYINGTIIQSNLTGTVGNGLNDNPMEIARDPGQPTLLSNIDVSVFSHYNRRLTDAEVRQNFEALRGRYGL